MVERVLAPYEFSRRTEYSKMVIVDTNTGLRVADEDKDFANKLLEAYKEQTESPDDYFVINGDVVNELNDAVFQKKLRYLFIPEGITTIGYEALVDAYIFGVSLPNSLRSISELAFYNCSKLQALYIPDFVTEIGERAFDNCLDLTKIRLPLRLEKISSNTFRDCCALEGIDIPDSVEEIENGAFENCTFESIKLPKNLRIIGNGAFEDCANLKEVIFPPKLRRIVEFAFAGCESLKSVELPSTVEYIGWGAFAGCFELENIKLSEGLTSIEGEAFANCRALKEITLPDTIKTINGYAFRDTRTLDKINIPRDLKCTNVHPFGESNIKTLIFNHDLKSLKISPGNEKPCDLVSGSEISKLIISNNVKKITPDAFKYAGFKIKEIEYLGTEQEFNSFKEDNEELFKNFPRGLGITFVDKNISNDVLIEER